MVKYLPVFTEIQNNNYCFRGYLHETGTNSDRYEFVSTSIRFFFMHLHETGLTMNSDQSDFVLVAGPRREILVPV